MLIVSDIINIIAKSFKFENKFENRTIRTYYTILTMESVKFVVQFEFKVRTVRKVARES